MINLKYSVHLDDVIGFIVALDSFLLFIKILEMLKPDYFILIRFTMKYEVFGEYVAFSPFILVLTSILLVYMFYSRKFIEIGIAVIPSIILYFFVKLEIVVIMTFLLISILLYSCKIYREYLRSLLFILILLQALSFIHYIFLYFGVTTPFEVIAYYEYRLQVLSRIVSPQLGHLLMVSWVFLVLPFVFPRFKSMFTGFNKEPLKIGLLPKWFVDYRTVLTIAVLVAIFASIYPWGRNINSEAAPFATDILDYIEKVESLETVTDALSYSRGGLYLFILLIRNLFNFSVKSTVSYLPAILNPLTVLANFYMVKRVTGDNDFSALTSLFYTIGLKIPITMSAFFLANSMGMIFLFISLGSLFNSLNKGESVSYISIVSGILLIFTHEWTYIQYAGSLALFMLIVMVLKERNPKRFTPLIIFLVLTGGVYLVRGVAGQESHEVEEATVEESSLYNFNIFWTYSHATYILLWGGMLGNTVYLLFSIIGFTKLDKTDYFNLFIICLVAASSIIYMNALFTRLPEGRFNHIPARLVYNIPNHIFVSLALVSLLRNEKIDRRTVIYTIFFVIMYMSTNLFRSLYHITSA